MGSTIGYIKNIDRYRIRRYRRAIYAEVPHSGGAGSDCSPELPDYIRALAGVPPQTIDEPSRNVFGQDVLVINEIQ
jgi:hypothetical protein